jgi:hypothetical protein
LKASSSPKVVLAASPVQILDPNEPTSDQELAAIEGLPDLEKDSGCQQYIPKVAITYLAW